MPPQLQRLRWRSPILAAAHMQAGVRCCATLLYGLPRMQFPPRQCSNPSLTVVLSPLVPAGGVAAVVHFRQDNTVMLGE